MVVGRQMVGRMAVPVVSVFWFMMKSDEAGYGGIGDFEV